MTIVYVVTYQSYLYPDEYEDMERVSEGFEVKGVYSTKAKAQRFIKAELKKDAIEMCGDNPPEIKDFIEKYRAHYSIEDLELDKQNFKD